MDDHSIDTTIRTSGSIKPSKTCQHPTGYRKSPGGCNRRPEHRIAIRDGGWWLTPEQRRKVQRERPRMLRPWRTPEERQVCDICRSMIETGKPPKPPAAVLTIEQRRHCVGGSSEAHSAVSAPNRTPTPKADSRRTRVLLLLYRGMDRASIANRLQAPRPKLVQDIAKARRAGYLEGDAVTPKGAALLRSLGLIEQEVA